MGDLVKMEPETAKYLDIPVLENLVKCVEDGYADGSVDNDTAAKAAAYGIFAHYFQPKDGFVFLGEREGEDKRCRQTIIRIGYHMVGDAYPECCVVAEVKRFEARVKEESLEQLRNLVSQADFPPAVYWTILIHGPEIVFYEFNDHGSSETEPFYARTRPSRNQFHLRHDADTVHEMLQDIAGWFKMYYV